MTDRAVHRSAEPAAGSAADPVATYADPAADPAADPWLWLEEVDGERARAWVGERSRRTEALLRATPGFDTLRGRLLEVLDSRDQIPAVQRVGPHLVNLWRDAANPRGLWRRTTLDEYRKAEPAWETLLDVDALGRAEGRNWVWAGARHLGPDHRRALVSLSLGGADAVVVREFDLAARRFVPPHEGGFELPEAKTWVAWIDADTVLVGTDTGPGSMTDSGYPRTVRRWSRGQRLADAPVVFEVARSDLGAFAAVDHTPGFEHIAYLREIDFYRGRLFVQDGLAAGGRPAEVAKPEDAIVDLWRGRLLIRLRSDWAVGGRRFVAGSLLVTDAAAYRAGVRPSEPIFEPIFEPAPGRSLAAAATTRGTLILTVLDQVSSRIEEWTPPAAAGAAWRRREVDAPYPGTLAAAPLHDPQVPDDPLAEAWLLQAADFLEPESLQLARTGSDERETLKARPRHWDSAGARVEQRFATSADGTRVPYFVVWPRGATADGANPTLLYGYGGFEIALQPSYSGTIGRGWIERGGVYVVANLRGGGEFGPAWHQAAIRATKHKTFEDFAAVAEDLIARGVTSPRHLGIQGGSNGGLLVGATMLRRPELFAAVVCQVPLLDMRRYTKLLAGASWVAEYGDPDDPAQWAFISRWSPYHLVPPAPPAPGGVRLPAVLLVTSTRDDRVHPGHARKMAALLAERGHDPLYWENTEGGHGGAADNAQRATMMALQYAFLWRQLGAAAPGA